jgi:hypothetical protein
MKKLLITGCRRSGTTLLASMIGAHSKINMLNEAYGEESDFLVGKPYQGVKLAYPHIKFNQRYGRLWRLFYHKIAWFRIAIHKLTGYWIDLPHGSKYSLNDYGNMEAKIVIIVRDREPNVLSMVKRANLSFRQASRTYDRFEYHRKRFDQNYIRINYSDLTHDPRKTLTFICQYLDIEFEPAMLESMGMNNSYANPILEKKK